MPTLATIYTSILNAVAPTFSNYSNLPGSGNYIVFSQTNTPISTKQNAETLKEVDLTIDINAVKLSDANTLAIAAKDAIINTSNAYQKAAFFQDETTDYDPKTKRTNMILTFKTFVKL